MSDILAVDVGTQSLKAGIVDHDLKVKARRQIFYSAEIGSGTRAEIDPELLWQAFIDSCSGFNLDRKIEAITFSTLCPSLVAMSGDGKSIRPMILHLDRRSHSQALWALKRVGQKRSLIDKAHLLRTHAYPNRWLAMKIVVAGGGSIEWFRRTLCRELSREVFYNEYFPEVLKETTPPDSRFKPYLSGDRHSISQKAGAFTGLSLSTSREELLLSLARGIASSQIAALKKWRQEVSLADSIFHVGGGASQPYSEFKERLYKDYKFINKGQTTLKGAADLAFTALKKG